MIYQTYQPRSPLSQFVKFLWYWEEHDSPKSRSCILPLGSTELVIDLREDEIPLFEPSTQAQSGTTKGARVCGVHSGRFIIEKNKNCSVIGANLKPGAGAVFFNIPAGELHNQIISLEELWLGNASDLRDRLRSQTTLENRFRVLEQFLFSRMRPCDRHPAVEFALREFERSPTSPISKVMDQIGFSTRYFNQLFRDRVGLTPKLYCRVRRLQHVLRLIDGKEPINWVDVASTCGYFDQSHLIHDFQTFANCTPTEYLAKRGFLRFHLEL